MAIASAVYRPCFKAFLFPFEAPGEGPPCILHLTFFIAGDRHGFPLLVFAPQRGLDCMSKSMGLSFDFDRRTSPGCLIDVANDGVVCVDGDMLHSDRLLPCSAVLIQTFSQNSDRSLCLSAIDR